MPLISMCEMYRDLVQHPAWLDYTGHLFTMRDSLEQSILAGVLGPGGEDQTPAMRASYFLLNDILLIPDKMDAKRAYVERELMGVESSPPIRAPEGGSTDSTFTSWS